jgi:putative heme-binding domain-containing protein
VQRAALIALDQVKDSPLKQTDVTPLLHSADAELSRAALWVMTHHSEWADGVVAYLNRKVLLDDEWTAAETATVREALIVFAENQAVQSLMTAWLDGRPLHTVTNLEARRPFLLRVMARVEVKVFPKEWQILLGKISGSLRFTEATRLAAIHVIQSRALTGAEAALLKISGDEKATPILRLAALDFVAPRIKIVPQAMAEFLKKQTGAKSPATIRAAAARAMGRLPWSDVQLELIATQTLMSADGLTLPLVLRAFEQSKSVTVGTAMVRAMESAPKGALNEAQAARALATFPVAVKAAAKLLLAELKLAEAEQGKRLKELAPLLAGGDVGRGRKVFFGQKAICGTCHTIGKDGGHLGPDLTSIGAIRSGRDILEAIVFPNATQVPGHETFLVRAAKSIYVGIVVDETASALTLRNAPGVEVRLERSTIKSITPSPISLMPAGLGRNLTQKEFRDLLTFLQSQNGEQWLQPSRLGKKDLRVRDSGIRE